MLLPVWESPEVEARTRRPPEQEHYGFEDWDFGAVRLGRPRDPSGRGRNAQRGEIVWARSVTVGDAAHGNLR